MYECRVLEKKSNGDVSIRVKFLEWDTKQSNKHSLTTVVNAVLIWGMFRDLRFLMGQFIIRGKTFHTGTGSVNLANL